MLLRAIEKDKMPIALKGASEKLRDMFFKNMSDRAAKILKDEGYVKNVKLVKDRRQGLIRVYLKYTEDELPVIQGMKRVSRPGCRVYTGNDSIPKVMGGLGTAILSTPKGIQTGKQAKKDNVGGEVLCHVW